MMKMKNTKRLTSTQQKLVLDNMGLVIHEANKFWASGPIDMDDLIQAGMTGLINAAIVYDNERCAFSSFACPCIRNEIITQLSKYGYVVTLPKYLSILVAKISKLLHEGNDIVTISNKLDISEYSIKRVLPFIEKPLDIYIVGVTADEEIDDYSPLEFLTDIEEEIFTKKIIDDMTYQEIGKILNINRESVRTKYKQILCKLRGLIDE